MEPADLDRIQAGTDVTAMLSLRHPECHAHFKLDYSALVAHGRAIGLDRPGLGCRFAGVMTSPGPARRVPAPPPAAFPAPERRRL